MDLTPNPALFLPQIKMSPFANQPELWLTGHLQRLNHHEQATKIQTVVRGFLKRERFEKKLAAHRKKVAQQSLKGLTVAEVMYRLRLDAWAKDLPTALEALRDSDASDRRHAAIWHASVSLRFTNQSEYIESLQWADYHDRYRALQTVHEKPHEHKTIWERFTSWIMG